MSVTLLLQLFSKLLRPGGLEVIARNYATSFFEAECVSSLLTEGILLAAQHPSWELLRRQLPPASGLLAAMPYRSFLLRLLHQRGEGVSELMQELLLGIWEEQRKTELFVTRNIDEAVFMGSRVLVMSARPGRIKLDREVPIAHPRHYSIKTTPLFSELKAELTEQVRVEVRAAQAAMA